MSLSFWCKITRQVSTYSNCKYQSCTNPKRPYGRKRDGLSRSYYKKLVNLPLKFENLQLNRSRKVFTLTCLLYKKGKLSPILDRKFERDKFYGAVYWSFIVLPSISRSFTRCNIQLLERHKWKPSNVQLTFSLVSECTE